MTKAYTTPALLSNGSIVGETLGGTKGGDESTLQKPNSQGSVGFYL